MTMKVYLLINEKQSLKDSTKIKLQRLSLSIKVILTENSSVRVYFTIKDSLTENSSYYTTSI